MCQDEYVSHVVFRRAKLKFLQKIMIFLPKRRIEVTLIQENLIHKKLSTVKPVVVIIEILVSIFILHLEY